MIYSEKRVYPILFSVFIWIYQFSYYSILAYQPFAIGLLFPCLIFIFKEQTKFEIAFIFGRYFLCGLYFFAGFLKVFNGGVFNLSQMINSFKITVNDFLYYNIDSFRANLMSFFIVNEEVSYFIYILAVILELCFIVGFFTFKYDLLLLILFFTFHIVNYIILDLPFYNHFIIACFFLPLDYITKELKFKQNSLS